MARLHWVGANAPSVRSDDLTKAIGENPDSGSLAPLRQSNWASSQFCLSSMHTFVQQHQPVQESAWGQSRRGQVVRCQGRADMVARKQRRCVPQPDFFRLARDATRLYRERSMLLKTLKFLALLVACMVPSHPVTATDLLVDGVPLPPDVRVASTADAQSAAHRQWAGIWVGAWGGSLKHILLVESIAEDGVADVVYAIGDNPALGIPRGWTRHKAAVSERSLNITGAEFSATYRVTDKGTVTATCLRATIRSQATMAKADFAKVTMPGAVVPWMRGKSELLQTDLVEDGRAVRLEAVIFKPPGTGPFPLAVINHGSTGSGDNPALFAETWFHEGLADFLNERGWIVTFPQRRGRGKSAGLYDEGISADRAKGYTGDPTRSLAGADRALRDIEAAIAALRRRPDVAPSPILIGGQSRGGAMAVAYAGAHPDEVFGVINFVGGWLGEGHSAAQTVNQTLFGRGVRFSGRMLWLYGRPDPFYSIPHSRESFAAFEKAGGRGTFLEFDVPDGNGHYLMGYSRLWSASVGDYLDSLSAAERK